MFPSERKSNIPLVLDSLIVTRNIIITFGTSCIEHCVNVKTQTAIMYTSELKRSWDQIRSNCIQRVSEFQPSESRALRSQ